MKPKYKIGTTFVNQKKDRSETVVDIYTTTDHTGAVIRVRYATAHTFAGQEVRDYNVLGTTIARSLCKENGSEL